MVAHLDISMPFAIVKKKTKNQKIVALMDL